MSFRLNFINEINQLYEKEIKDISEDESLDSIIYGVYCDRIKNGSSNKGILSLSDKIPGHLCFSNKDKDSIKIFQLKNVASIAINQKNENLKNYIPKSEEEQFLQININHKTYDFSFNNKNSLFLFVKGLISLFKNDNLMGYKRNNTNFMEDNINALFNKNNDNFDNILDDKEFKNLAKEIGVDNRELLLYVDLNKDGIITKEEIMNYFNSLISGVEFSDIFKKYSSIKNNKKEHTMNPTELKKFFNEVQKEPISDLEAYQLLINFKSNLSNETKRKMAKKFQNIYFYNKYQINKEEINKAMEKLNKSNNNDNEIEMELYLKEFSNMLHSFLLTVYNKKKQNQELNTNHSLVDYYINSSHNTYLKGHQLKGYSDPKMYAFAVLKGFRLVELDCYNGQEDEIIITHGYTFVTKLKLEDILKELKENSFKNSPYPVILSIENHLDQRHQQILAEKLQKYLVDLYIFPYETPPKTIPTLEDLKYKFIIKCGGKRLYENKDIPLNNNFENYENNKLRGRGKNDDDDKMKKYILEDNYDDISDSDEDEEGDIEEFDNSRHEIIVNREHYFDRINIENKIRNENKEDIIELLLKKSINNNNSNNEKETLNIFKEEKKSDNENEEKINNNNNLSPENDKLQKIYNLNEINLDEEKEKEIKLNNNSNENININEDNIINIEENKINENQNEINEQNNIDEVEREENEYITKLENIRGLLGQKFKYERIETFKYKHWEFVTLKSTLYLQLFQNFEKRKKIINLSFHCMMKAYPQKFNSSNYDIIKCWCCGCQTAAINIQAVEDDFTLFNQVFFTQNNNCGYVLKPKKLLLDTFIFEDYKKPKYFLIIEIINLFNFIKLAEVSNISRDKKGNMKMKIYTLGPYIENDKTNSKIYKNEYNFDLIGGFLTPNILNNHKIKIPVYEESLGGIMIKFIYEKEVIGRGCIPFCLMKMGYRKIPIYDNNCIMRESIFVVGYFEKVF